MNLNRQPATRAPRKTGHKIGPGQSLLKRKQELCDLNRRKDSQSIVTRGITRDSSTTRIGQGESLLKPRAVSPSTSTCNELEKGRPLYSKAQDQVSEMLKQTAAEILHLERRRSASQRRVSVLETQIKNIRAGISRGPTKASGACVPGLQLLHATP
ncbi:uncharacterized protein [Dermacentor albipictus]|uniref:uncharacterized protein n=1 Tax=Dermacentor albipictus TaxID=60249 RepID=UPI0038FCE37A